MTDVISIIGAGPSGLYCAWKLLKSGFKVCLYDSETAAGKKLLVAGKSGLNLTHSMGKIDFVKRYGKNQTFFKELLDDFGPLDLVQWCKHFGVETFIGSSGRYFPTKMKASEFLKNWIETLKENDNFELKLNHKFIKIDKDKNLTFLTEGLEVVYQGARIIFAMGGGSWRRTGSDGSWVTAFDELDLKIADLKPMNCGFEVNWSEHLKKTLDRSPLKNITISLDDKCSRGELMITPFGVEGGAIYELSSFIREEIESNTRADVLIDLKPDLSLEDLKVKLKQRRKKDSLSNFLRKSLKLSKIEVTLLYELCDKHKLAEDESLAICIKAFRLNLLKTRPIDEAISTSGGVCFSNLNEYLELKSLPGVFFAGEMLDFEAPTGGFLLQGCFSTAHRVCSGF